MLLEVGGRIKAGGRIRGEPLPIFSGQTSRQKIGPFLDIADVNISVQPANQYLRVYL
jgi:hypothetical protein